MSHKTSRINFDIGQRLWDKLDMAAGIKDITKRKIVERALEKELVDIPEPPENYKPKNKKEYKKRHTLRKLRDAYQKAK